MVWKHGEYPFTLYEKECTMPTHKELLESKRDNLILALGGIFAGYLVKPKHENSLITLILEYKIVFEQLEEAERGEDTEPLARNIAYISR